MRKLVACTFVLCAVALGQPAEKAAATTASTLIISSHMVPPNPNGATFVGPWITVLSTQIKPPGGKDLIIEFSAQTALLDVSAQVGSGTAASATINAQNTSPRLNPPVHGTAARARSATPTSENLLSILKGTLCSSSCI